MEEQVINDDLEKLKSQEVSFENIEKRKSKTPFVMSLIKRSLILAMAIFMLISAFLPIVKYETEYNNEKVEVRLNAIDGIHIFVNSLLPLDEEDIKDELDDLYDEAEKYESDWNEGEELDQLSKWLKKGIKLYVRSEDVNIGGGIVFVALFSIAQIIISILLAVFAALYFASAFAKKLKGFPRVSLILLGLNPVIVFANAFAFKNLLISDGKITVLQLCVVIISALIMLTLFVLRLIFEKQKIKVSSIVKHCISLVLAMVLLLSAFGSIVSTEVKTNFKNSADSKRATSSIDSSLFYAFELSEDAKENYDKSSNKEKKDDIRETFSKFNLYSKRDFEKGKADTLNKAIFADLLLAFGFYECSELFGLGTVFMILLVLCALVIIWQNLYELATGKRLNLSIPISAKVIAIIMAAVILTLAMVISVVVTENADYISGIIYKAQISYAPILMLISAVAVTCIPPAISKKDCVAEKAESL